MLISLPAIMLIVASLQLKFAVFTDYLGTKRSRYCNEQVLRGVAGVISFLLTLCMILSVVSVCLLGLIWPELHDDYNIDKFAFGMK